MSPSEQNVLPSSWLHAVFRHSPQVKKATSLPVASRFRECCLSSNSESAFADWVHSAQKNGCIVVSLWSPPIGEFGSEAVLLEMAGLSFAKCSKGIQSFQEAG